MSTRDVGRAGEEIAAKYLEKQGAAIIARNFTVRGGEIDLIAEKDDIVHFVEVKLRKSAAFAQAREFVDYKKQERLKQTALLYLSQHEENTKQPRFDVIEVYAPEGMQTKHPEIFHLEDAFA